jgi:transcription-repair coupling factor (superfamily II helicase)
LHLSRRAVGELSPFAVPPSPEEGRRAVDLGGRRMESFAASGAANVFDAVRDYLARERRAGRVRAVAAYTVGSRDRLANLLTEHGVTLLKVAATWEEARCVAEDEVALVALGIEHGFSTPGLVVVGEQDILGEGATRASRPSPRWARLTTASA